MLECGAPVSKTKGLKKSAIPEHLNRSLPVTDKPKGAWQKRAMRRNGDRLKSVCRELPAWCWLDARATCIVCGMNRCMQAEAVTDDTKSCSMPEQFRQGV